MATRVLLVDDDQMLLSSMERCLGLRFDLTTVQSGLEALRAIEESDHFPVVVSDMRMPVMDGIQFIERARVISPSSVFLMLTGNQDVQTAIRAVNEGNVFRFLNKPTDPDDIATAIEAAARQHSLETAERDLLNKTFVGAVAIFADVMETLDAELLGRAATTVQLAEQLIERVGIPPRWELKIAAKLALVGAAINSRNAGSETDLTQPDEHAATCEISARLVDHVPRLDLVARIIRATASSDGELAVLEPRGEGDIVRICGAVLRLASLSEAMAFKGLAEEEARAEIKSLMPKLYPPLLEAAANLYTRESSSECVAVAVEDLREGMVLHQALNRSDGSVMLQAGRRMSNTHIDKLAHEKRQMLDFMPVVVTAASFQSCGEKAPAV